MNRDYITFSFAIQELFREYATSSQHLKTEHDMHRKQAELEDRIQQRLKEAEREREMEARKVMLDLTIDNKLFESVSSIRYKIQISLGIHTV